MKILTESGFTSFEGVAATGIKQGYQITFDDNSKLCCSTNHAIKLQDQTWALARELTVGDLLGDKKKISSIENLEQIETYSPINVENDFSYYSEGIVHHNCAFVENWDEFFSAVFPTISSGESTKILFTSTPNGLNHFYKTCIGAKEGTNGYQYVEVPWQQVPGRDEAWRQETLAAMDFDHEKFAQEFECHWLGSSGTLISGAVLKSLTPLNPIVSHDGLKVYEEKIGNHQYVIMCDVSRGKGLDYSAFSVVDVTTMPYKQVCTFKNNMVTPLDYTGIIFRTAKAYNEAAVLVEVNDVGAQVADSLFYDFEYEGIIHTENAGARGKRISGGFLSSSNTDRGVRTTKTVKAIGCSMLKLLIEQRQLIINDHNTISELSKFSKKGASYEAESGSHDDLVMGLVLFGWMSDQQYFKDLTDINTLMKLRDKTDSELENDLVPFGFIETGNPDDFKDVIDLTATPSSEFKFF